MIKKLKVKNFKSLRDFECDFSEPISVFAGPNMSGKSNVLDALSFISESVNIGLQTAIQNRNGYWEIKWKGNKMKRVDDEMQPEYILFLVEGDIFLQKYKRKFDFNYFFEFSGDNYGNIFIKKEELNIDGQSIITVAQNNVKIRMDLKEPEQFFTIHLVNQLALQTINISNGVAFDAKSLLSRMTFYTLEPASMKNAQNPSASQQFLMKDGRNLSSWLLTLQTKHPENFTKLTSAVRNIFPEVVQIFANITQTATVYLSSKENYLDEPINLQNMSDGELKLISLLSLIFAPPELTPPFIAVEEPENYLHPGALKYLVELFRGVRADLEKQPAKKDFKNPPEIYLELSQIFITTHSLVLIDNFKIEELIIVKKAHGETTVVYPKDHKDMKELIEDKEIGLGSLYFSGALR
ncbi:MAG: AAA family ATPase [Deltaproteobacteria bacterium]|nr:AAA family ATPase [Deltaproteobacteria bacterium]